MTTEQTKGDLRFNPVAKLYSRVRPTYPPEVYRRLVEVGGVERFDTAVDVACGAGQSIAGLKAIARRIIGIDPADKLLSEARIAYPDIEFRHGTGEETGLPGASADLVTVATAFYWMDKAKALREVDRVLRPRGVFATYKYDFPVCIGPAHQVLLAHLNAHWDAHRSARLTEYDATADLMREFDGFASVESLVVPYVLVYPSVEGFVGFVCSTSYVSAFLATLSDAEAYIRRFTSELGEVHEGELQVRFDIIMNIGKKR